MSSIADPGVREIRPRRDLRRRRFLRTALWSIPLALALGTDADAAKIGGSGGDEGVDAPGSRLYEGEDGEGARLLAGFTPVTDADLAAPADDEWLTHRRDPGLSGFSPLDGIDRETVAGLELAWSWALSGKRTESQPLIRDGIMFLNQSADIIQALDAATGDLLWSYKRELPDDLYPLAYANRNIALYGEQVIVGTSDAHLVALDARTGEVNWDRQIGDHAKGYL